MITTLLSIALVVHPQASDADLRREAVEGALTPSPWVSGHRFNLLERMAELNVPGVSVAVLHEGAIDWAGAYGVRDSASKEPVTVNTLFQAGSISKPVSAMAAHLLAQKGELDLDSSINEALVSWQLPMGRFEDQVTPAMIMGHVGGLSVHGFAGYASFDPVPSVVQILDGLEPANSAAVRRIDPAGKRPRYSGGGSTVLQLAMCDLAGSDFASLLSKSVLAPLMMTRSTFSQPLPVDVWPDHAAGHGEDGRPISGRFRTHPERFAAGLWTTASDLARFALEIQDALQYDDGKVLKQASVLRMLQSEDGGPALGVMIEKHGDERWFGHGGSNMGFKNDFRASFEGGRGVFILTNGDRGSELAGEITRAVAQVYDWPGVVEDSLAAYPLEGTELEAYTGRYGSMPDELFYIHATVKQLFLRTGARAAQRLAPIGRDEFLVLGSRERVSFTRSESGTVQALRMSSSSRTSRPRLEEFELWPMDDLMAGETESACDFYREVFEADAEDPMVTSERLELIGGQFWDAGQLPAGVSLAELSTEFYPENPTAWFVLARMRASLDEHEAAIKAYETCLTLSPKDSDDYITQFATSMLRGLKRK